MQPALPSVVAMLEPVVVGHGMVGYRLVPALSGRDTRGRWRITVLGEVRATDGVVQIGIPCPTP